MYTVATKQGENYYGEHAKENTFLEPLHVAYLSFVFRILEHLSVEATILQVTNNEAIA